VSVLDRDDVVYVARVPTRRIMTVAINVGTLFPAYATSMGRVLLAGLPEDKLEDYLAGVHLDQLTERTVSSAEELRAALAQVRRQGYALVDQELEAGLRSLAAPVRDKRGRVIAAVNISSHVSRLSREKATRQFLPLLLETAERIEQDLRRS
jgi:IclR family pca regulon transcriptional regulator